MLNDKLTICDETGIILNDGVTIYPGYLEIKDNVLTRFDSLDPNNDLVFIKRGILHHRVEYKQAIETAPCDDKRIQGKHFMSRLAMDRHLTKTK
jgi:hypothetical protein